jgi:hypothetical protein
MMRGQPFHKRSYLWTYDLYAPVRNAFDAAQVMDAARIKSITHSDL